MITPTELIERFRSSARAYAENGERDNAIKAYAKADIAQEAARNVYRNGQSVFDEIAGLIDGGCKDIERLGTRYHLTDGASWYPLRKGYDLEFARLYLEFAKCQNE